MIHSKASAAAPKVDIVPFPSPALQSPAASGNAVRSGLEGLLDTRTLQCVYGGRAFAPSDNHADPFHLKTGSPDCRTRKASSDRGPRHQFERHVRRRGGGE